MNDQTSQPMQAGRENIIYEYRFQTTPQYLVVEEKWELYDVFLKYLDNGAFVFVPVYRRKVDKKITPVGNL